MKNDRTNRSLLETPKPLLEVKGIPIIERTVKKLVECGVQTVIVINPEDENIFRERLAKYEVSYCYQRLPLGTGHALYCARNFVKDDLFLVFMGDDISSVEVESLVKIKSPTVFGYEVEDMGNLGALIIDSNGMATDILEKKMNGEGVANTGIYVMSRNFFDIYNQIPKDELTGEYYLTHAIRIFYGAKIPLRVLLLHYWKGINTPNDLRQANEKGLDSMMIRKAQLSDMPRLLDLLHQLSPIANLEKEKNRAELRSVLKRILSNNDYFLMVAEIGDEIVATATLLIQENLSHQGRPYGHIENVVTDQKYRNNNVGEKMIHFLVQVASFKNCYKVILNCSLSNIHFYQKSGFKRDLQTEMRLDL